MSVCLLWAFSIHQTPLALVGLVRVYRKGSVVPPLSSLLISLSLAVMVVV